jgi:hypothetical protein
VKSSSHFVSLSEVPFFVMIIILSSSDEASLNSDMICCTTVTTESVQTNLFPEFPVVADAAARGAARFSHLSVVPVVAGVQCLGSCVGLLW